jgi:hypothetical protein
MRSLSTKNLISGREFTEEQLAICWVYSNCWKIPPIFIKKVCMPDIDFNFSMPEDMADYDTFQNGIFTVLSTIVSEDWQSSEWRRMCAMGEDYWADAEKRLFPLETLEYV